MSFETALDAAIRLLEERGQLLNGHLFRLVESDADLFQQIRKQLIDDGIAEDRSGVGLVLKQSKNPAAAINSVSGPQSSIEVISEDDSSSDPLLTSTTESAVDAKSLENQDWWLMTSGAIRGPLSLRELCAMRQYGEMSPADVIRQGEDGQWQLANQVPILAATIPQDEVGSSQTRTPGSKRLGNSLRETELSIDDDPLNSESNLQSDTYVPPNKTWIHEKYSSRGFFGRMWHTLAGMFGGSRRLTGLVCVLLFSMSAIWWWQQPPLASTIFREYSVCRAALKRLQDRRVVRSEFELIKDRHRPRIEFIVKRLKSRATDYRPLDQALYRAGMDGLLPMFDDHFGTGPSVRAFDDEMEKARKLLGYPKSK